MEESVTLRWIASKSITNSMCVKLEGLLSIEERARAAQFCLAEDRRDFVAAHALTRAQLSQLTARPPPSFRFRTGPFGKPAPILEPGDPAISFNLSHTRGCVVVALGIDVAIGVDVEWIERPAPQDVADRYFAQEELAALNLAPERCWDNTFYTLWTLKEAYMKATGMGMQLSLDSFAVALDPPRLLFGGESGLGTKWQFRVMSIGSEHIAALAVGRSVDRELKVETGAVDLEWILSISEGS